MIPVAYLDNAATTPLDPEVAKKVQEVQSQCFGNSQSNHSYGWEAANLVEDSRTLVQASIGARFSDEVSFTSGATESNNWVFHLILDGLLKKRFNFKPEIIISAGEHPSVTESAKYLADLDLIDLTVAPLSPDGQVTPDTIKSLMTSRTVLVSVMWVQNEIGTINPIEEISSICAEQGVAFHTDATQALGRLPINVKKLNVTYMSASAHKIYGPKGIGFLYHNPDLTYQVPLSPLLRGGGHESGRRSGTLALPLIAGLAKACQLVTTASAIDQEMKRIATLRHQLLQGLIPLFDDLVVNTPLQRSVATHLHLSWQKFLLPKVMVKVAASRGSACSSQKANWMSPALLAMGVSPECIQNSLRLTLGRFTTEQDISVTLQAFSELKHRSQLTDPSITR